MEVDKELDRTIYHAHPATGEFIGLGEARLDPLDDTFLLIPAQASRTKPPVVAEHQVPVLEGDDWIVKADYRGVIYSTETGLASQHFDLGDLPEGFTHLAPPGEDFAWSAKGWALDEGARAVRLADAERAWRNGEVDKVKWLRERHRDEQDLQKPTTLTDGQFAELLGYLQALRDWPQSQLFPQVDERPVEPSWITEQHL